MTNLKDYIEAALKERQKNDTILAIKPEVRAADPELAAALERVAKGELAKAYRTNYGALVTTNLCVPEEPSGT